MSNLKEAFAEEFEGKDLSAFEDEPKPETEDEQTPEEVEPEGDEPEADEVDDADDSDEEEPAPKKPTKYEDDPEEVNKAKSNGWTPFDEFVENGGDPKAWKTAKHFNEYGVLVDRQRKLEKDFQDRLQNVNLLHQMQMRSLKSEREQLEAKKREAVEDGNWEQSQIIDRQLQENAQATWQVGTQVNQNQEAVTQAELAAEAEWERQNPWINVKDANDPDYQRAEYARQRYAQLLQSGIPVDQRIQTLERELQQVSKPAANPNRNKPAVTDAKQSSRNASSAVTWADLSAKEKGDWEKYGKDMFPNQKAFLKAVQDSRKGKSQ